MKRCPECRRDYYDDTLSFCLEDGTRLVYGVSGDEPATAILAEPGRVAVGLSAGESSTMPQISSTDQTVILNAAAEAEPHEHSIGHSERQSLAEHQTEKRLGKYGGQKVLFLSLGIAVLLLTAGFFAYRYSAGSPQINSIAVLPFENGSGNADLDYLSDGVSESVIDRLSQLGQLKVIARSSSFRYRGQNLDLKEIANTLGVQAIVTGRVLQRGDGYSIRVDVTDVHDNKQLWGENFTRKASDIQIVQTDIAREIAENLSLRLSGAQTQQLAKQGTTKPEAYELLLKGRFWLNKAGNENFVKAVGYYETAVAVDPGYALALAELAEAYRFISSGTTQDRKQRRIKAAAAALNALRLDDNLAEAHIAEAGIMRDAWEWQRAESEYKRAIELNPNISAAHGGYATYLSMVGRHDEAIAESRRAREISPLSLIQTSLAGSIFLYARRYDEALEAMNKRLELDRTLPLPVGRIGEIYEMKGLNSEAILSYRESVRLRGNPFNRESARLGAIYAKLGERTKAEDILQLLESGTDQVVPTNLALLYEALGRRDEAFMQLEKAFTDRDPGLPFIYVDPAYDSMRSDSRFQNLLRRMNLPE